MGCEYVCRCKRCKLKPDHTRCGRTVTGVSLLTNMEAHTCGDLAVCGDFFCKECWAICRVDPDHHVCKPPGDVGTLTPEHLENIQKRVEARREGKRRRRAEQAVLREIARQQSGERPNKRSQRSIEKATATLGRIVQEEGEQPAGPAPMEPVPMEEGPPTAAAPLSFSHQLDALADAAAEVDANDILAPGIKPKQANGGKRPIYEQADDAGLPPRSKGEPIPPARRSRTAKNKEGGGSGGRGRGSGAAVQPMSEVQELAVSLGMPPAVESLLTELASLPPEGSRLVHVANMMHTSAAQIVSLSSLVGTADHEACCADAVSVLAIMRQLEARLHQALQQQGITLQPPTTDNAAPQQLPVLPVDMPLQVVVPVVDATQVEVVVAPQQTPMKLEVLPADAVLAVAQASAAELTPPPEMLPLPLPTNLPVMGAQEMLGVSVEGLADVAGF